MTVRQTLLLLLTALLACGSPDADPAAGASGAAPMPSAPAERRSAGEQESVPYRVATVVEGLQHPWGLAFLPGGEGMLVTERSGRLRLIRNGQLDAQPISGVPAVRAQGQGGLLDVVLHPDFARNRLVYLSYSKPGEQGATTAIARGRLDGGALVAVEDIIVADAWGGGGQHFGSRIVFDAQGLLYFTIGDRGTGRRAQDLGDHAGATIRVHDDGRVPADNPFVGRAGARAEIFTYGNRNAQGMTVHPQTGEIWQHEHGPRGGDEINVIVAGANYGWPEVSFGNHYDGRRIRDPQPGGGVQLPLLHWTPSIAPSGMMIYSGDVFPQWRGDVFAGALAGRHLRRVRFDGRTVVEQEELLTERNERIRDVRMGPDGLIYLLTDAPSGRVLRLEPATDAGQ